MGCLCGGGGPSKNVSDRAEAEIIVQNKQRESFRERKREAEKEQR